MGRAPTAQWADVARGGAQRAGFDAEICIMRTTISLDEQLSKQVRWEAAARGMSVSAFLARTPDDALKRPEPPAPPPFRLVAVRGVRPRPGIDLDRTRALDAQEDEARFAHGR